MEGVPELENISFSPVPRPPQPKSINLEPPKYTVPDVTLMFDSDDSLIWRPGERPADFLKKKKNQNSFSAPTEKENISSSVPTLDKDVLIKPQPTRELSNLRLKQLQPVKEIMSQTLSSTSPTSNISPQSRVKKNIYNPQLYVSPTSDKVDGLRTRNLTPQAPTIKQRDEEIEDVECPLPSPNDVLKQIPQLYELLKSSQTKSVSFENKVPEAIEHKYSKYPRSPPPKQLNENQNLGHDMHILKLIEGQNQQILYLHKVLEKVLDKSNSDKVWPRVDNQQHGYRYCSCKTNSEMTEKKVAIVQTSFEYIRPEMKSVATNTDLSWADLISSRNNDKKHPGSVNKNSLEKEPSPNRNDKRDCSLSLAGINLYTEYDATSPEPSLHLDLPDFVGGASEVEEHSIVRQYEEEEEGGGGDYQLPLMGESALMYSERQRRVEEEAGVRRQPRIADLREANVGTTFYNNALNNLQQILGKAKTDSEYHENSSTKEQKRREDNATKGASNHRLHLQQFGISFLDSATLNKNQRGVPDFDTFYSPAIQAGAPLLQDLEVLDGSHGERKLIPRNHVSDAKLVAIARNSPSSGFIGTSRKQTRNLNSQRERRENEYSFATQQFLGKYELDD